MKTECWYLNTDVLEGEVFNKAYSNLKSAERKAKIDRLEFIEDKKLSLGVGIIAERLLENENATIDELTFDDSDRPCIKNNRFYISLSHSGNYAVGVKSYSPVGIDVEKIKSIKKDVMAKYFTEEERLEVKQSKNGFFEIWTKKESYIKMLGKSVLEMANFDVTKANGFDFFTVNIDNHVITVCVKKGVKTTFSELKIE